MKTIRRTATTLVAALLLLPAGPAAAQERPVVRDAAAFVRSAPSDAPLRPVVPVQSGPAGEGRGQSTGLAVVFSLLLPGMGELYAGDYGIGKYFTGADAALWLALAGVDYHARSLRDDARSFAAAHAGFAPAGKDDSYWIDIGNFDDVDAYNEQVLRDRDAFKLYDPSSSDRWRWDSRANREAYRGRRVASDEMFNNTRFVVAALAVNRVLSAINAARIAIGGGSGGSVELGARLIGTPARPRGVALSITRPF